MNAWTSVFVAFTDNDGGENQLAYRHGTKLRHCHPMYTHTFALIFFVLLFVVDYANTDRTGPDLTRLRTCRRPRYPTKSGRARLVQFGHTGLWYKFYKFRILFARDSCWSELPEGVVYRDLCLPKIVLCSVVARLKFDTPTSIPKNTIADISPADGEEFKKTLKV